MHRSEIHPDAWQPAIIRDPADTEANWRKVAGAKYSYRQLDNYTDLIQRTLQGVPETSTVTRSGVLNEQIYLDYSQQRLAQYGYDPSKLKDILNAQNITLPAGSLEVGPQDLTINPSGLFPDAQAIGNVIIGVSSSNSPVYLRDLVDISRAYQSPPTFLNYLTWRDASGQWLRSRAITLGVNMRSGAADRPVRQACGGEARRPQALSARRSDHRPHLQPAGAGERTDRPVHGRALRSHRPGRDRLADRLLGVALGAADGDLHPHHAGDDLRHRSTCWASTFSRCRWRR